MIKVKNIIKSFLDYLADDNQTKLILNNFVIGSTNFIVFENISHEILINNLVIKKINELNLPLYYFRSYDEMFLYFNTFDDEEDTYFVLIG